MEEFKKTLIEILQSEKFKKNIGLFYINLRLNGFSDKILIVYNLYQGDNTFEFSGIYSQGNWVNSTKFKNDIYEIFLAQIDEIVNNFDINDFYDQGEFQRIELEFNFNFREKELEIKYYYTYYDTTWEGYSKEFQETSEQVNDALNEFCQLNKEFKVNFEGSGDSGFVDDVGYNEEDESFPVPGALEDLFYSMLETYAGWEINEGSQGHFVCSCSEKTISLSIGQNYEASESKEILRTEFDYNLTIKK